jgi:hypothetical protein
VVRQASDHDRSTSSTERITGLVWLWMKTRADERTGSEP